jgi:hypothetical protein
MNYALRNPEKSGFRWGGSWGEAGRPVFVSSSNGEKESNHTLQARKLPSAHMPPFKT